MAKKKKVQPSLGEVYIVKSVDWDYIAEQDREEPGIDPLDYNYNIYNDKESAIDASCVGEEVFKVDKSTYIGLISLVIKK